MFLLPWPRLRYIRYQVQSSPTLLHKEKTDSSSAASNEKFMLAIKAFNTKQKKSTKRQPCSFFVCIFKEMKWRATTMPPFDIFLEWKEKIFIIKRRQHVSRWHKVTASIFSAEILCGRQQVTPVWKEKSLFRLSQQIEFSQNDWHLFPAKIAFVFLRI